MVNKVPDAILESAGSVGTISFWSPDDPEVGQRLSHFSVASAWTTIGNLFDKDERYGDLAETFQFVLSLRKRWGRMSKQPTSELLKTVDDIAQTANALGNKIQANIPELDLVLGPMTRTDRESLATEARRFAKKLKCLSPEEDSLLRPTKPNEKSAETTYCVKALTTYLLETTGQTHHSSVGAIVGALLDLGDAQPNADLVSKLTRHLCLKR
jgi:hypothetical protein